MSVYRSALSIALVALSLLAACSAPEGGGFPPPGDHPFEFAQKITAADAAAEDMFGYLRGVAIDGNRILVGARHKNDGEGAAYVYELQGGTWTQVQKLEASDGAPDAGFGEAVALDGGYAFVGAHRATDAGLGHAGVVYVFELQEGTWTEVAILRAPDPTEAAWFGSSIDLAGDRAIVGAYAAGLKRGSAYFFHLEEGVWELRGNVQASDAALDSFFGVDVAIEGDMALVGSWGNSEHGINAGAAYVFEFDGDDWVETDKLSQSNPAAGQYFGNTLAMDGEYAIIATTRDDAKGIAAGSARVFKLQGGAWAELATLYASDGKAWDMFGVSIALSGEYAVIGTYPVAPSVSLIGAAYVFKRTGETWTQVDRLASSPAGAWYGMSAALDGDWLVVGAPRDNERATRAGAAFVYKKGSD